MSRGGRPEAVPLWATPRHPTRETLGGRVARVQGKLGQTPMPWQRDLYDVAFEIDPATGGPWYREVVLLVLRQAGKTTIVRTVLTDTCLFVPDAKVRYTAQNRLMASQRLEDDFYKPLARSPLAAFLDLRVGRRAKLPGWSAKTGQEHIAFSNGSKWSVDAVKATSGHGPSLNKGAIDEAFAHADGRVEQSMRPGMITIPDAQLWVTSAAGDASSHYLRKKVTAARDRLQSELARPLHERRSRTLFLEYAAPKDADREDPETWWRTHPALGYTITEAAIAADFEGMEAEDFDRAYLGWWPERKVAAWVIPQATWNDNAVAPDTISVWQGEPVWAIDVAPERDVASIAMAGTALEGRVFVDCIERRPGAPVWCVDRLVELRSRWGGQHVGLIDSARSLAPDLEAAGFVVRRLSAQDRMDACGAFYDDAMDERLRHVHDEDLDDALSAATKRMLTQEGGFVWARGRSLRDITPLYAATVARFLWVERHPDDYDVDASLYGGGDLDDDL
ncbi:MAG: hypothetical protein HGA44_08520 [Cellulomonadaceae bacterium]|nr:hypothetical protein [Cellulomonadaceae bacterium]